MNMTRIPTTRSIGSCTLTAANTIGAASQPAKLNIKSVSNRRK
jgi:hypothetical protein